MRALQHVVLLVVALLGISSAKVSRKYTTRIVAVGDIHGDLDAFVTILKRLKLIEEVAPTKSSKRSEAEPGLNEEIVSAETSEDAKEERRVDTPITMPRGMFRTELIGPHVDQHGIKSELYEQPEWISDKAEEEGQRQGLFDRLFGDLGKTFSIVPKRQQVDMELQDFAKVEDEFPLSTPPQDVTAEIKPMDEDMPDWRIFQEKRVERYHWIGGETVLVQTGDMVDRGADTIAVYTLLKRLQQEAKEAGGEVIPLLGNHETMNICGMLHDVSDEDYATFGPSLSRAEQEENRRQAFSKTGFLGEWIRKLKSVVKVGDMVYSHAGIVGKWAQLPIAEMNQLVTNSMDNCESKVIFDENGPQWNRAYDVESDVDNVCDHLTYVLDKMKAKRMVIGHNPQIDGFVRLLCGKKLILIDVAMSVGMKNNRPAAIETAYTDTEGKSVTCDSIVIKYARKSKLEARMIKCL